jgi:hypothetical protein
MALIAYASRDPLPIINPSVDEVVSAAFVPDSFDFFSDAVDTLNPGGPFSYFWTILSEAVPGSASFALGSGPTDKTTTIEINAWSNTRLFMVVTNTATMETSETNPLLAPDSAFVHLRVTSVNEGIQKHAPGERNYFDGLYDWADAIEAGGAVGAHDIAFHSDVVTATGAKLELLVDGSYAEDPPGTDMHTHRGAAVDLATAVTRGTVTLEDAGSGACIQRERIQFAASPAGSVLSHGFWPGVVVPWGYDGDVGGNFSPYCSAWRVKDAVVLEEVSALLADGGTDTVPVSDIYQFTVYTGSVAQYNAGTLAAAGAFSCAPPAASRAAINGRITALAVAVPAGNVIAVACTAAPKQSDGVQPGALLTLTVHAYRQV